MALFDIVQQVYQQDRQGRISSKGLTDYTQICGACK